MKHTEGWHIEEWAGAFAVLRGTEMVCESVCNEADARLIAKAPEMAALLREKYERERWWATDGSVVAWIEKVHTLLAELEEHE